MRAIVLIIDALGIGEMPDVEATRPRDKGANTLLHIAQAADNLSLPNLEKLGLGNLIQFPHLNPVGYKALASWGKCLLKHVGADTFMGHQELMGSLPLPPQKQLMSDVGPAVHKALENAGYQVEHFSPGTSCLLVNRAVLVADNMETEAGLNINVTANIDRIPFERLVSLGKVVRQVVDVARVIVVGGRGYTLDDIRNHIKTSPEGSIGVDTPGLGVYNEWYVVRHLGKGINLNKQAPTLVKRSGLPVSLIGKAADVVQCEGGKQLPMVNTAKVFELINSEFFKMEAGLIVANVQETDLAGHEQDAFRWAALLNLIDHEVGALIERLTLHDVLILTGDHGNDPTIGHSEHTREMTPFLFYGKHYLPQPIGERATLADVGATVADLFRVGPTEYGTSILNLIR